MSYKQYCILNNFGNLPSVTGDGSICIKSFPSKDFNLQHWTVFFLICSISAHFPAFKQAQHPGGTELKRC